MRRSVCIFLLALFCLPSAGLAETFSGKVRRANSLYKENQYQEALKKYQEAQVESPADERVMFNLGNAQYKLNEYESALPEYLQSAQAKDPKLRAQSHYNAGNTLYRMGKLEEAVDQYLRALEYNPDDEDAKYNLEFVRQEIRRRMNEQRQRQEQQEQQKQQPSQKPDDKQQQNDPQDQREQHSNQDKEQEQEQRKESGAQNPEQAREQGQQREQEQSASGAGEQAAHAMPENMSPENAERYLEAVEAETAKNMKEFLKRQQPGEVVAFPKDW